MALFKKKKETQPPEPQWFTSVTNLPTYNYKVYYMSKLEKILYFLLAFAIGAVVGYLFYGGLGRDEFGQRTTLSWILDISIPGIVGLVAGRIFVPARTKQIRDKNARTLNSQFRDFLEAFNTSIGAGKNVVDSFHAVYDDMRIQFEEDAFIVKELEVILSGMANNFDVEDLMEDLGNRSGNDDIVSFANVFRISYRKGGNLKDTINTTHSILSDKMEIKEEIETMVSASKMEQTVMIFMPVGLIGIMKSMSPDFAANFATPAGIASTTIAIGLFIVSYFVGRKILNIKL
ncbi:MAG: type II secretion system F family protein [Oscillospiraceae bacterium]|jgi:tight adherence protein B|nr:type II secretion system F family protein [Oscillospiraceae bacterium]